MDLNNTIDAFINSTVLDYETTDTWNFTFRGSALPICPRQLLLSTFYRNKIERSVSFSTKYSYHVGSAIHSLVQETWARQGLLWGDWRCSDVKYCGVIFNNTRLDSGKCLRCGSPAIYIEKHLKYETVGFSGHCDGVVYCSSLDSYLVFELKSRNSNIISKAQEPYESDLYQVSTYATLLARKYWLRIAGRVVLWIGKPRPKPYKFWYYPGIGEDLAEQQFKIKADLDQKIKEGKVTEITGCCETPNDAEERSCPFAGICLSPARDRLIEEEYKGWLLENGKGY